AALGRDDRRPIGIDLQLATKAKNLHVEASVADVLMDACRLQEMLAGQWTPGRVEKGHQQGVFTLRQRYGDSVGVGKAPVAPIEMPATEPAAAGSPRTCLLHSAPGGPPPQHCPNARQKLAESEWLRDVVVGAKLQCDSSFDRVASMARRDDHRNVGNRSDV